MIGVNIYGTPMKIIDYVSCKNVVVEFQDNYKYITRTRYSAFLKGNVSNPYDKTVNGIGYLGVGPYATYFSKNHITPQYQTWKMMLNRVYDKYGKKRNESYKECVVSDEWLNFQNFAKWYEQNYYQVGDENMHLDKDILCKGNKIYSPEHCVFVPASINKAFIGHKKGRGKYPIGVFYSKDKQRYTAMCHNGQGQQYIGDYKTPEDAFYAYKTYKEGYIKHLADEYKSQIPDKIYNALYNYKIEITD